MYVKDLLLTVKRKMFLFKLFPYLLIANQQQPGEDIFIIHVNKFTKTLFLSKNKIKSHVRSRRNIKKNRRNIYLKKRSRRNIYF